jgi:radical SAM enzyme (rSAM/lipoprotein system)
MTVTHLSLRKRVGLSLFKKFKENESQLHELNYILWECTLRCNLKCLHCGSDCKKDASLTDMPAKDFLKAIDDISRAVNVNKTMVVLTGGEALLRNDLEQIGVELYKRGFPWGLVTNGMLLSKQRLDALLNAGLRAITVSLDGLEESHNWLRGNPKSYTSALNAIRLLPGIPSLKYDVVTCVHQRNFKELEQLKELLIETGVKAWRLFTIFPIGRAKEHKDLQLEPGNFKSLFDFIVQTRKEGRIDISYGCEGFLGNYEQEVRDHFFFCRAGISIASILADGSISACPNLRDNYIQGSIYRDSFKDVWENRFSVFRDKSWTKTGICADCEYYTYCEGNGMHLRDEKKGELLFCHLNRIKEGEMPG